MKSYLKTLSVVGAVSVALVLAGCNVHKRAPVDQPKVVKTERVVVAPSVTLSLQSLDKRVTDIESRMAKARAQYAKDRALVLGRGQ